MAGGNADQRLESCLYEGRVRHRRHDAVGHAFSFPLCMAYLDLGELDRVFRGRWLWSTRRPALVRFARTDHLGDPREPLDQSVRALVEARTGRRPRGPIRLLTQLRHAGYVFNPISLYYCFAPDGRRLDAVVADVSNTPWLERHAYVLLPQARGAGSAAWTVRAPKALHVSPFLPMALSHVFRLRLPGERLVLRITDERPDGSRAFEATLAMRRREIGGRSLAGALVRHPLQTAQLTAGIYWQALRLAAKRAPFHAHPGGTRRPSAQETHP